MALSSPFQPFLTDTIFLLALIALMASLLSIRIRLLREESPSRTKDFLLPVVLLVLTIAALYSFFLGPHPIIQDKPQVKGIGITRAQVIETFKRLDCPIKKSTPVKRLERWMGHKDLAVCEVIGPANDVRSIYFMVLAAEDGFTAARLGLFRLNEIAQLAAPEWAERSQWILNVLHTLDTAKTVQSGRTIEMNVMAGIGIEITVSTAD